jgi:hypothetical protein
MIALPSGYPDWRNANHYAHLRDMPRSAFAWEWLRRSSRYRDTWSRRGGQTEFDPACPSECFGLVDYEDPAFDAAIARPLWTRSIDPSVLIADVLDCDPEPGDAFNLLKLASLTKLRIGVGQWEHVLLSDGTHGIRLDIATGSVVGSPSLLAYRIQGQASAKAPAETLRQLTALIQRMAFSANHFPRERRTERWILELRAADAIALGATAHDIAAQFYPGLTAERRWRVESYAARRRVQRLVARARDQHVDADVGKWFVQDRAAHLEHDNPM